MTNTRFSVYLFLDETQSMITPITIGIEAQCRCDLPNHDLMLWWCMFNGTVR